ncbi:MAG: hypothetical protein JSV33_07530 [bacterium]|nr:MAG: hypothetical protein JSV33_07530 [bacterium]
MMNVKWCGSLMLEFRHDPEMNANDVAQLLKVYDPAKDANRLVFCLKRLKN